VDPTIIYQNLPLPPARGRAAFERQMRWFDRYVSGFEARIHAIAADGPTVLTQRTDVIEMGRMRATFWVCGTFEVRNGKVALWRDYFDYADVTIAFLKSALAGVARLYRGSAASPYRTTVRDQARRSPKEPFSEARSRSAAATNLPISRLGVLC
jgi:limonene-1,2-epoxide hydrolase